MGESILSGGLNTFESQKQQWKRKGTRSRFLDNHDIEEEDDLSSNHSGQKGKSPRIQLVYETWELMDGEDDDDDDGVPL